MIIASAIVLLSAALLQCAKFISAAIFMSGVQSWDAAMFGQGLKYVGSTLDIFSVCSVVLGLGLMLWYFFGKNRKDK